MRKTYTNTAKFLHWLIFLAVASQYAVGEFMPHIGKNTKEVGLVCAHIFLGGIVLALIALAIVWRFMNPVPQLPELPKWQRVSATLTHWTLYALIIVMCVLGWAAANSRGWPVTVLGVPIPALAKNGERWAHTAGDVHTFLVNILLGLVILHAGAALYHHFILRDKVLKRILPGVG